MPSNGTAGMDFEEQWCVHCFRDAAFRNDMENNDGCEILAAVIRGEQPKEWIWRGGKLVCTFFSDDPDNPVHCPLTMEMF